MESLRGSWFLMFIFSLLFHNSSAKHGEKLPSAMVVGTVYCDTCFQQKFSKNSHFMPGASVAIECGEKGLKSSFLKEVKTNDHGVFEVSLPFAVGKHVKKIKKCSVKLISSSEPYCAVASTATSSSLHLKSRKQGLHIFSAGFFTFKPLKQPQLCYQKPRPATSDQTIPGRPTAFFPPIIPPIIPSPPPFGIPLPPNPFQPPPLLPPVPILNPPSPPFLPPIFPPNPLQPPPLLPPIPILNPPSPPFLPPIFPPNPVQPPPLLPPIPILNPPSPSPSPPPPVLPFPFPPLPFPPFPPIFPGIPPASPSRSTP